MTELEALSPKDAYDELWSFFGERHDSDDAEEIMVILEAVRRGGHDEGFHDGYTKSEMESP